MKIIIVGAGEVGMHIAERLAGENKDVVLIDRDPDRVELAKENLDVHAIRGHGSSPRVLVEAGIDTADVLIAVTTADEVNMVACLIAQSRNSTPIKIARIRNQDYADDTDILKSNLGIDLHINPEKEAADAILRVLRIPCANEVIDLADGLVRLVGVRIGKGSPVLGQELRYLSEFHADKKVLIAAIERGGRVIIPRGADRMEEGDSVWVLATPDRVEQALAGLGLSYSPVRRLVIFGGTTVTAIVVASALAAGMHVRIVEKDYRRCVELAERFPAAVVLHSQFADRRIFEEENVGAADAFIAAGEEDEDNILSALLAKRFGVPKVITVLERPTYNQIVANIGVDIIVSKRLAAVNRVMAYMRLGKVRSDIVLGNHKTEVLEFEALETSRVVGKALKDVGFPDGVLVAAIIRNAEVTIPGGLNVIEPGDRVLMLASTERIKVLEKLFVVNLSYF